MIFSVEETTSFPNPNLAEPDGLLAVGGDLTPERLLNAYLQGVFPWYNDEDPILWWSPDPRCVLEPKKVHVSKSMKTVLSKNTFSFTINQSFENVIRSCAHVKRKKENATWINNDIIAAYTKLHELGLAHSVEVWENDTLVGGLYGVAIGKMFFGESMFSKKSNASKAGFIWFCKQLDNLAFTLIDCQIYNDHLGTLGAIEIPRSEFLALLEKNEKTRVHFPTP